VGTGNHRLAVLVVAGIVQMCMSVKKHGGRQCLRKVKVEAKAKDEPRPASLAAAG